MLQVSVILAEDHSSVRLPTDLQTEDVREIFNRINL